MSISTKVTSAVATKIEDKIISNASSTVAKQNAEIDNILSMYNDSIKGELRKIINQHSILGAIIGPVPSMGILPLLNLIMLFSRLGKAVKLPVMQEFDHLLVKAIDSSKFTFIKMGVALAGLECVVSVLDFTVVGMPAGIALGLCSGWYFAHASGGIFASNISNMVNEDIKKHNEVNMQSTGNHPAYGLMGIKKHNEVNK